MHIVRISVRDWKVRGSGALNVVAMASILALLAKEGCTRMSESKKKELQDWA